MFDKMNGVSPSVSSTYSNKAGISVTSVSDNKQEAVNVNSQPADKKTELENGSVDNKKVKDAIDKMNADARFKRTGCKFTYHEECNRISIKLYDTTTKEVIREIPSEDTIKMLEKLNEIAGLMIDKKL